MQLDISPHPLVGGKGEAEACSASFERLSAASEFRWFCSYAKLQMYLATERGRLVCRVQAQEVTQLRPLCLSNAIQAREHDYRLFIQHQSAITMHH